MVVYGDTTGWGMDMDLWSQPYQGLWDLSNQGGSWDPLGDWELDHVELQYGKSYIMGCFMLIVLRPAFFQHLCFFFHKEIPKKEGLKSVLVWSSASFKFFFKKSKIKK